MRTYRASRKSSRDKNTNERKTEKASKTWQPMTRHEQNQQKRATKAMWRKMENRTTEHLCKCRRQRGGVTLWARCMEQWKWQINPAQDRQEESENGRQCDYSAHVTQRKEEGKRVDYNE